MKKMCLNYGKITFYPDCFSLDKPYILEEDKTFCTHCHTLSSHLYFEKEKTVFNPSFLKTYSKGKRKYAR